MRGLKILKTRVFFDLSEGSCKRLIHDFTAPDLDRSEFFGEKPLKIKTNRNVNFRDTLSKVATRILSAPFCNALDLPAIFRTS